MHNLSFHIGVKLLRPKILSFTDGCWPFRHSKTVARWGRERRRRGKRGGGEGSPQPGEGKAAGKEERWRETMLESPALRKIQASNSVYTRQPRRTPFMILRNQATGVSNAFPRFFPFFISTVTRSTRPTSKRCVVVVLCEGRWFNVWRSRPGNCKHCPSPSSKFFATENRDNWYIKEANWIKNLASCPSCGYSNKRIK